MVSGAVSSGVTGTGVAGGAGAGGAAGSSGSVPHGVSVPGGSGSGTETQQSQQQLLENSLEFKNPEGVVSAHGSTQLRFRSWSRVRGWHEWKVKVIPVKLFHNKGSSGELDRSNAVKFTVQSDAQFRFVQIADVRQESPVSRPISSLWTYCQVELHHLSM